MQIPEEVGNPADVKGRTEEFIMAAPMSTEAVLAAHAAQEDRRIRPPKGSRRNGSRSATGEKVVVDLDALPVVQCRRLPHLDPAAGGVSRQTLREGVYLSVQSGKRCGQIIIVDVNARGLKVSRTRHVWYDQRAQGWVGGQIYHQDPKRGWVPGRGSKLLPVKEELFVPDTCYKLN